MSLYRQAGRSPRALIAVALAGVALGAGAGYGIGRCGAPEPSAGAVIARLAERLRPVAAGLALLPTEYPQSAQGAESSAVRGDLERIAGGLAAARDDVRRLDPAGAAALERAVAALRAAVARKAPPAEVTALAAAARRALAAVPGGS